MPCLLNPEDLNRVTTRSPAYPPHSIIVDGLPKPCWMKVSALQIAHRRGVGVETRFLQSRNSAPKLMHMSPFQAGRCCLAIVSGILSV